MRVFILLLTAAISSGCATTWDTMTSRKFRQKPFSTAFATEDPLTVMKTSVEGDERAGAMRRLKEPLAHGGTSTEQDEALQLLTTAAVSDPSPVVRVAAIDALGRFKDERTVGILTSAFNNGDGVPAGVARPKAIRTNNPEDPAMLAARYSLRGPVGFPDEVTSAIRSRAIAALASSGRPEGLSVIRDAAKNKGTIPVDRDTQLAAVRGLAKMRSPESVVALVEVMKDESGKDPAMTARARESLVSLTGKDYAADPAAWETAMRSGTATIVPEPTGIELVGAWFSR